MDKLCVVLLSVVTLIVPGVSASHFRGAIISWRPGSGKNEIIIDYRISWRRDSGGHYCNSSSIQSGETITGEGAISCFYNCHGSLGSLHYQCTDYSLTENWTSGKGMLISTLSLGMQNRTDFAFGYNSQAWISALNVGAGGWELRVEGDLAVRNDTGTINSSPRAEIIPIVRLQYGCQHTIRIPVSDPDQDKVKCRWAESSRHECGGVCKGFPHSNLNETTCTLTYYASYSTGWYAVAIQVEDFANEYESQPLSSIPVQFLVNVYQSSDSCSSKPEFIDPSPIDGACIVVPVNETFETTITADIASSNRSIAEIKTTSPLGMVKSPLMQINSTTWQINVTWAPTAINDTSNVFCFTATDTSGQQSDRRCITLLSGVSKPRFIDGYGLQSPVGIVSPDQRHWTIAVDSPFVRGSKHSYIRLYSNRGTLLETIAASDSRKVILHLYNQSIEFITSTNIHENQSYYFLFDSGVVRSASYCGADSDEIRDPFFWRFSTEAVPIRLVNGTNRYSGRVELFHDGSWGTVCDDDFDRDDAEVICRMLGMLSNDSEIEAFQQAYFGQGNGSIVLDDLRCYGHESSLEHCRSSGWMHDNCGHGEDAGVSCHASIRLVNGYSNYSGRVEVYHDGEWGTVCDDNFDINDAKVICRQLNMYNGDNVTNFYSSAYFGPGSGRIALDDLNCHGYEHDIDDCRSHPWFVHNCGHNEDTGVDCQDGIPLRLVNGSSQYSGRVEVYHDGAWGTICDDSFDRRDAEVICRMLGMLSNDSHVEAFQQAHFGPGSGSIVLDDLECNGDENNIGQCRSSGWMNENCGHREDAGVSCQTTIRLVNGYNSYSGRVEVYHNDTWGTICDDSFGLQEAIVVCRQLGIYFGYSQAQAYSSAHFGEGNGRIALDDLGCNGQELHIWDCRTQAWFSNDCSHSEDAGVDCNAYEVTTSSWWYNHGEETTEDVIRLRLVNGSSQYSGRVEVYHGGSWGTICDDSFDQRDAKVICRMLGMLSNDSHVEAFQQAHFGPGSGRIVLDDLECNGDENSIGQCRSSGWMNENCGHGEDAGVSCQTTIRLVNGYNSYSGRVEVYHNGTWGTVCDDSFGLQEAIVVCRQLGIYSGSSQTQAYSSAHFGEGYGRIALDDLSCNGQEQHLGDCRTQAWFSNDCSHSEDAGVDCNAYEITTSPWWYNHGAETTEVQVQTPIRLANGPTYYSGRVEIYHNGSWGTICDDNVDNRTVKIFCKMLGYYIGDRYGKPYTAAYFGQGTGQILLDNLNCSGYESDITQCMTTRWYTNDCSHSEDAGVDCHGYIHGSALPRYTGYYTSASYITTTTSRPWYQSTAGYSLADAIRVSCNENGWNIRLNLALLRHIHPGAVASDIYLGENSCTGVESWNTVTFHQGLHECLTSQMMRNDVLMYRNQLVYAQRDPAHPFIIRHYNWTIGVECDVSRNETSSGHIHHDTGNTPIDSVLGSSHYFVNMSFYSDPNFMQRIQGNPIHVTVGTKVYVKVYSTTSDWTIKMKVHTCYTKPTATASDHLKYDIIKNGCEMDSNTHIISQSSHETRFVFEDFEYTSNHEGLYVFCDAIFCRSSDYSRQCMQTCNP